MNRRIHIYAYMQLNLGDDLLVRTLCSRYPNDKFYIICNSKYSSGIKDIANLMVFKPIPYIDELPSRLHANFRINNILKRAISHHCDAIVNIGGSIFMESKNWERALKEYKRRMEENRSYFFIGCNFGPFENLEFLEQHRTLFKNAVDICFRDKYSYDLFSDLENARYAPDVVFTYKPIISKYEKKQIIISVIDLSKRKSLSRYEEIYFNKMVEISRYFAIKGYSVKLMGFCSVEGDKKAIEQILLLLNEEDKKNIVPLYYSGDINDAVKSIQESQFVIATRFHAMILGWICNKNVYPIIYSEKTLNVLSDIKFTGPYSKIENIDQINVENIYEYFTKSKPRNFIDQMNNANLQFKKLDEFLSN